jgi:hypothetical protein
MTQETKTRKNTDYSASAVNLCNPPVIELGLNRIKKLSEEQESVKSQIDALIPAELREKLTQITVEISELKFSIENEVDKQGSYQDLTKGWYAIKQRKVSKSYNPNAFESCYPKYAQAVIIKAVDTTKLKGLQKADLIGDDDVLRRALILLETESFAYIIKA